LDNRWHEAVNEEWFKPLQASPRPKRGDQERIINAKGQQLARDGTKLCQGCPISNLAQEMSPLGKGFQKRIARIYDHWRQSIATALENGIEHGTVRKDVSPHAVHRF
jgi:hypothetical protein